MKHQYTISRTLKQTSIFQELLGIFKSLHTPCHCSEHFIKLNLPMPLLHFFPLSKKELRRYFNILHLNFNCLLRCLQWTLREKGCKGEACTKTLGIRHRSRLQEAMGPPVASRPGQGQGMTTGQARPALGGQTLHTSMQPDPGSQPRWEGSGRFESGQQAEEPKFGVT